MRKRQDNERANQRADVWKKNYEQKIYHQQISFGLNYLKINVSRHFIVFVIVRVRVNGVCDARQGFPIDFYYYYFFPLGKREYYRFPSQRENKMWSNQRTSYILHLLPIRWLYQFIVCVPKIEDRMEQKQVQIGF